LYDYNPNFSHIYHTYSHIGFERYFKHDGYSLKDKRHYIPKSSIRKILIKESHEPYNIEPLTPHARSTTSIIFFNKKNLLLVRIFHFHPYTRTNHGLPFTSRHHLHNPNSSSYSWFQHKTSILHSKPLITPL